MELRRARHQVGRALVAACAALGTLAASGCAAPPKQIATPAARQGVERLFSLMPPLELVSPRDAIVRLVGTGNVTCTGTLFADDLVLTAHHCVSARDKKGRVLNRDMAPEEIQIELGHDELPWGEVRVRAIVAPQCGYVSGDGDIAILVLDRHLIGMPTSPVRIEAPPEAGEVSTVFGFGRCACSEGGIKLRSRGEGVTKIDHLAPGHLEATAAICPGDSGGPVYGSRSDIIGVVSAAVMDGDENTADRAVFTRLDAWPALFVAAHEISNGASPSELPPYSECRAHKPARPAAR